MTRDAATSPPRSEADRLRDEELALSWVRLAASPVGLLIVATFADPWPGGGRGAAGVTVALVGLLGLAGILALRNRHDIAWVLRVRRSTLIGDAVLLLALSGIHAHHDYTIAHTLLLFLPLEGALKAGPSGALRAAAVIPIDAAIRVALRVGVFDLGFDAEKATFLLVPGAIITAAAVLLSRSAEDENRRARQLARQEQAARRSTEALHSVTLAGLEEVGTAGLRGLASLIARYLGIPYLAVARRDGAEYELVTVHGLSNAAVGDRIDPIPDGPLERMAATEQALVIVPDPAQGMDPGASGTRRTALVPIRSRAGLIGAIIAESPREDAFDDLDLLEQLAVQLALLFEVQAAFSQQAEVAEHFRALDRIKDDFLAVASHEIRTPLTAIAGIAEMLHLAADRIPAHELPRLYDSLWRSSRRMSSLLQDLEQLSVLERGDLHLEARPHPLDRLVESLGLARQDGVRVEGAPGVTLHTDPVRTGEVLRRLLDNARQHAPGSPVEITWETENGHALIRVRDHGPGVPPELRTAIFETFGRGTETLRHQRGMGLGLTLSRELTRRMGGDLYLDADVDRGACFVVQLPVAAG